jgi:hypothetical protein
MGERAEASSRHWLEARPDLKPIRLRRRVGVTRLLLSLREDSSSVRRPTAGIREENPLWLNFYHNGGADAGLRKPSSISRK